MRRLLVGMALTGLVATAIGTFPRLVAATGIDAGGVSTSLTHAREWLASRALRVDKLKVPQLRGVDARTAPAYAPVAAAIADGATVRTDKADYHPYEQVLITGSGWSAGETVNLTITEIAGDYIDGPFELSAVAQSDGTIANGDFWTDLHDGGVTFELTAVGQTSGLTASTTFTDASIGTYDQCSNDDGDGYAAAPDTGCRWVQGNLQANNSTYHEGDATPQRLWLTDLPPGTLHTTLLRYGTTKQGTHAYDFLTSFDWSENWIVEADRCQDITGCVGHSENVLAIPEDPNVPNAFETQAPNLREFKMRGGTLSAASVPAIFSGDYTGDSETEILVSFTVDSSGSMCHTKNSVTTCDVALWFGAHIAKTADWQPFNGTTGAGDIEGSPYHVADQEIDGDASGRRDNQMQAATIVDLCAGVTCTDTVCADLECNPANGVCEVVTYQPATTVCRASAGVCDVPETCTGNSATCPTDTKAPATTTCRASAGVCDVAESCDGLSNNCPADGFVSATTTCRASAGVCDVAESCTGSSAACPADGFVSATTTCRASAGVCDVAESCTGSSAACPADGFVSATTTCRASAGVCDVAESCTGSSAACPADGFASATTTCRASAGVCDVAESCTGGSADCPADGFASATTTCRPAVDDVCDVAESCDGSSASCPADEKAACAFVTDSALCQFDRGDFCGDTESVNEKQFAVNFSPDVQQWPAYKQNSTNPGQYYYNLLYGGDPTTLQVKVPYPFITQGARPLHIYDGATLQLGVCLVPGDTLASIPFAITENDWLNGTHDATRNNLACDQVPGPTGGNPDYPVHQGTVGDNYYCTFDVPITAEQLAATQAGQVYVNLHVDWGFKGPRLDVNPADGTYDRYDKSGTHLSTGPGVSDALVNTSDNTGPVGIADCREFVFSHDTGSSVLSDKVQNTNAFKKVTGVLGNDVNTLTGSGTAGVPVYLVNPAGKIVASGVTDIDGYYFLDYKHTGKAALYKVLLGNLIQTVTLQANGLAEVSYDPGTNTWTVLTSAPTK